MTRRKLHFHLGMDHTGHRHLRLRDPAEMRRARERRLLHPIVIVVAAGQFLTFGGEGLIELLLGAGHGTVQPATAAGLAAHPLGTGS